MTGLDLSHRDVTVRPQDDFFRYLNGSWLATAEIAPDRSSAGAFVTLTDEAERNVRAIIEEQVPDDPDSESGKIALLYSSFLAEDELEKLGASPLSPLLDRVAEIRDSSSLAAFLGRAARDGYAGAFSLSEDADPGDPKRYVYFLYQGGLGLPDEEYYRLEEHAETLAAYRSHVERVLTLAGVPAAAEQAELVLDLETRIAALHWDKVSCRDFIKMFNPSSLDELAATPGFDWHAFVAAAEIPHEKLSYFVNAQPSFFTGLAELAASMPIEAWRAWARWHTVSALSPYLSSAFVEERFDFYGRTLAGTEEIRPRWKRAISFVESTVGEAVGRLYVERHFLPESKAAMEQLVENLIAAYRDSISQLDWMTDVTRAEALKKLTGFRPKIGYRNNWRDYSALHVGDSLIDNVLARNAFEFDRSLSRVLEPVDVDDWEMLPQTVNAYYHPLRNEIVFPAAMLQPPFFTPGADDAVNYGAIGSVIGHEIGHGFDDKGSTTDAEGRIRNWWTDEDHAAFRARTGRLVDQFDGLSPMGVDGAVNGELTLGENIGDLGGVGIAYRAWLLSGGEPDGEEIDGFTPKQRFFLGYGAIWRSKRRPEMEKLLLSVDQHSPAEFRVNKILSNIDAFHEAFDTQPGDGLWLDPDERISIW